MKRSVNGVLVVLLAICICPLVAQPQDTVKEGATNKLFPKTVSFEYGGKNYSLSVTGVAARKKLVFKGYGVAHYMDVADFESKDAAVAAALSDAHAKQITMDFARGIGMGRIRGAFRGDFKKHATDEELSAISTFIDTFIGYLDKEKVEENDQFVLRWLPGGTVLSIIQGEEKAPITNVAFASVLWQIWLGEHSVVNRDKLVAIAVTE
jgi:hypothetical protein